MINFSDYAIAVVIPSYKVEKSIERVVSKIPDFIKFVIIVDDCSPDNLASVVKEKLAHDSRVIYVKNPQNMGVGGATVTGFKKAVSLGAEYVVKMDGDDQMDSKFLPDLLTPLIQDRADFSKGNRFHDFSSLKKMPFVRRMGNLGLSFLTKAATGYWNCFDPTNGYVAVKSSVLRKLKLDELSNRYYFETSLLAALYYEQVRIKDVPMPAIYGDEESNLSVTKVLFEFPPKLLRTYIKRILFKYFIYDFSIASIYLLFGLPMLIFGIFFGGYNWYYYASQNITAPTGTVMISVLNIILGIQFLMQAIQYDINQAPKSQ